MFQKVSSRGPVAGNPDVLILGGGVVGSACAREMARSGRSVVVVEPGGTAGQGWQAAAGLLSPQVEAGADDQYFQIGLAGREYYRVAREELERATHVSIGLELGGIVQLASSEEEEGQLRERVAFQRQHGLYCDWLSPEEVSERWPRLAPSHGALFAPEDGALDPTRLVEALVADGTRLGVRRVEDRITAIEMAGHRIIKARGSDSYYFGEIILAAGAWSGRITGLPRPVSVEPVRGQIVALPRPAGFPDLIAFGRGHYLLTRRDEVLCGSTMEHVGFMPEVTEAGMAGIRQTVGRLCPELADLEPIRSWAGLRPGTPDGLPIIGREPRAPNLWYATGHGRNGILLAGVTGDVLRQLMDGEATMEGISAFRPERFWE